MPEQQMDGQTALWQQQPASNNVH